MEYTYVGECNGNNGNGCFMDSCGHDCGCFKRFPKDKGIQPTLETYKELEDKGVYIHYLPDHYDDGSNLNFSIEFRKQKTQTGWYNDNHEFGDVSNTMRYSMMIALWYLQDTNRIELINSGYQNPDYVKYKDELKDYINQLMLS